MIRFGSPLVDFLIGSNNIGLLFLQISQNKYVLRHIQTHTHTNTHTLSGLRIQDEVVNLGLMQVRLDAVMCCSHLTGHAKAAGSGAAKAAGRRH